MLEKAALIRSSNYSTKNAAVLSNPFADFSDLNHRTRIVPGAGTIQTQPPQMPDHRSEFFGAVILDNDPGREEYARHDSCLNTKKCQTPA